MRCPTTHGTHRCKLESGHAGECENDPGLGKQGRVVVLDLDAQRELSRAASRIVLLEDALRVVKHGACAADEKNAACACCVRIRDFAAQVLEAK